MALGWLYWRTWGPLVARHAKPSWQAWHLVTSFRTLHGTGGALGALQSPVKLWHFCVAAMALGDIPRHFAWKACHVATAVAWHVVHSTDASCFAVVASLACLTLSVFDKGFQHNNIACLTEAFFAKFYPSHTHTHITHCFHKPHTHNAVLYNF